MLSETIVVIDDDERVIQSLELALSEYEVVGFEKPKEAMVYLRKPNEVSLVLLDVMMPKVNGINILQEIKSLKTDLSVIMITAYGSKDVVMQALRNKADDFIEKPFDIKEIRQKIKEHLSKKLKFSTYGVTQNLHVERIRRFIDRNYNNVNLDEIASQMCLSPKYISRLFNRVNDIDFRDYKVQVKIKRAKDLLVNTSLSVHDISNDLGYQNPESFMRIFKQKVKLTPMQYRKKSLVSQSIDHE